MSSVIQMYMKDADALFIHINIMMSWQAMKQRELPYHDDDDDDEETQRHDEDLSILCRL